MLPCATRTREVCRRGMLSSWVNCTPVDPKQVFISFPYPASARMFVVMLAPDVGNCLVHLNWEQHESQVTCFSCCRYLESMLVQLLRQQEDAKEVKNRDKDQSKMISWWSKNRTSPLGETYEWEPSEKRRHPDTTSQSGRHMKEDT